MLNNLSNVGSPTQVKLVVILTSRDHVMLLCTSDYTIQAYGQYTNHQIRPSLEQNQDLALNGFRNTVL